MSLSLDSEVEKLDSVFRLRGHYTVVAESFLYFVLLNYSINLG